MGRQILGSDCAIARVCHISVLILRGRIGLRSVTRVGVSSETSVYYTSSVTIICGELVLLDILGNRAS
jgi:hypothetical protein